MINYHRRVCVCVCVIFVFVSRDSQQLATRRPDDTVSMVHYPPHKTDALVSVSGAGDW